MSIGTVVNRSATIVAINLVATLKHCGRWAQRATRSGHALLSTLNTGGTHTDGFDRERRIRRVNPGTGYPIARGSVDIGGYTYGSGLDDRRWDRE